MFAIVEYKNTKGTPPEFTILNRFYSSYDKAFQEPLELPEDTSRCVINLAEAQRALVTLKYLEPDCSFERVAGFLIGYWRCKIEAIQSPARPNSDRPIVGLIVHSFVPDEQLTEPIFDFVEALDAVRNMKRNSTYRNIYYLFGVPVLDYYSRHYK